MPPRTEPRGAPVSLLEDPRLAWIVAAFAMVALALRIACARGGLWLDEAWSAVNAHDAGTILGVLLRINHDNNHHLNTIWLQIVGPGAPPMLQRALSIVTGTLAVPLAAAIALRAGRIAAVMAAALFALSPILVTYGSEARGYAPMLLLLLGLIALVARWLEAPEARVPAIPLGVLTLLGMLAQLTFVFGLFAVALWACWELARRYPPPIALRRAVALLAAPVAAVGLVAAIMALGASLDPRGFQFGAYQHFTWAQFANGAGGALLHAFGGWGAAAALACLAVPGIWPPPGRFPWRPFALACLFPLGVVLLQMPNSGFPRYYLLADLGLLMLVAVALGRLATMGGARRALGGILFAAMALAMAEEDATQIADLRADPGRALAAMAAQAPAGAQVSIDEPRVSAILLAAANSAHYPLVIRETECPPTQFHFSDRDDGTPFAPQVMRCGVRYALIADAHSIGLSGSSWGLYVRRR